MKSKTQIIKDLLKAGEYRKAVSVASKFFDRSADTALFQDAQSAINNPSFYKQIGKDPDVIFNKAVARLQAKFN
jgi:hypothetical protein